eukprot:CAMPEP_0115418006 /NCGR_PEP_ID=MMETSP0271-20121206/24429_1 /TAXON_ID=71861 /ORGANISM="Scrippsiella trochoidea, Strain CCMP3099" /LENGTH=36 /DNA_ID= /DNA_START= /DNA_END= /DNA_ORIENTATION=
MKSLLLAFSASMALVKTLPAVLICLYRRPEATMPTT